MIWVIAGVVVAINLGVVAVTAGIGKQPRRFAINPKQVRLSSLAWMLVLAFPVLAVILAVVSTLIEPVNR